MTDREESMCEGFRGDRFLAILSGDWWRKMLQENRIIRGDQEEWKFGDDLYFVV